MLRSLALSTIRVVLNERRPWTAFACAEQAAAQTVYASVNQHMQDHTPIDHTDGSKSGKDGYQLPIVSVTNTGLSITLTRADLKAGAARMILSRSWPSSGRGLAESAPEPHTHD